MKSDRRLLLLLGALAALVVVFVLLRGEGDGQRSRATEGTREEPPRPFAVSDGTAGEQEQASPEANSQGRLVAVRGRCCALPSLDPLPDVDVRWGGMAGLSDADGRFAIEAPFNPACLSASRDGYSVARFVVPPREESVDVGTLYLRQLPAVRGVVKLEDGSPAKSAVVYVWDADSRRGTTTCDGEGRFAVWIEERPEPENLPAPFNLRAAACLPGFVPAVQFLKSADQAVELTLRAGQTVSGRVYDALTHGPVFPGTVLARNPRGCTDSWSVAPLREDGSFTLGGVSWYPSQQLEWPIVVEAKGYLSASLYPPPGGSGLEVPLYPVQDQDVVGRVTSETGATLGGGTVYLGPEHPATPGDVVGYVDWPTARTAEDGRFALRGAPRGLAVVVTATVGALEGRETFAALPETPITIPLHGTDDSANWIRFRVSVVTAWDQPIEGAAVSWATWPSGEEGPFAWMSTRTTDASGTTEFTYNRRYSWPIWITARLGNLFGCTERPQTLQDLEHAPVVIRLRSGTVLRGTVVDGDGDGAGGARVGAWRVEGGRDLLEVAMNVSAAGDGTFALEGIAPAHYVLAAWRDGLVPAIREVEVPSGKELEEIGELRLVPARALSGHVQSRSGKPLTGVSVTWKPARYGLVYHRVLRRGAFTDGRGDFRIPAVPLERLEVTATLGSTSPASVTLPFEGNGPLVFTLPIE